MKVRHTPLEVVQALVDAHNRRQLDLVSSGTKFHASRLETAAAPGFGGSWTFTRLSVTTADATDGPTCVTLVNAARTLVDQHFADISAHDTVFSAATTNAVATDTTTAITLANELKSVYNTHRTTANVHFNNDSTNATSAANATDVTTLIVLVNEIKSDFNAHVLSAPDGTYIDLIGA